MKVPFLRVALRGTNEKKLESGWRVWFHRWKKTFLNQDITWVQVQYIPLPFTFLTVETSSCLAVEIYIFGEAMNDERLPDQFMIGIVSTPMNSVELV